LIKVDEPHCETCGYLLYRLKSDRCPECGTPVVKAGMTNDHDPQAGSPMTNEIPMPDVQ
jgi:predicted amidophosphoribosyltransferase